MFDFFNNVDLSLFIIIISYINKKYNLFGNYFEKCYWYN